MTVKRQQGSGDQMDFFDEALKAQLCHGISSKGGTGAGTREEPQAVTAWERNRSLTQHLMEKVASSANLIPLPISGSKRTAARLEWTG
jgi:hypothetical protein